MNKRNLTNTKKIIKSPKVKNTNIFEKGGNIAQVISGAGNLVAGAFTSANDIDTSEADNAINAVNSYSPSKSNLRALANDINNRQIVKSDWEGSDFGMSTTEGLVNLGTSIASGAAAGSTLGPWGTLGGAIAGLVAGGTGWAANAINAENVAEQRNREAMLANRKADAKEISALEEIKQNDVNDFYTNLASNGGRIYIKPSKRGTFTAAAKQRGLGVQEFASKVLSNKEDYFTAMIRKANFAKNASKWHHAYGGPMYKHGGNWTNGIVFINEGGLHSENPFDGVLMGFDQRGVPNLVEEGEIIYNDYVFSNRLKPSKKQLESYGLNSKYNDWTFAKIVEDLQKGSAETPLDKISKESLDDIMATIINMQEEVRIKKGKIGQNRLMASGGTIFDTYDPDYVTDRKNYYGIDPILAGRTVDISNIINAGQEKLNFYNEPFVPDTFEDLPDVTPTRAMLGKENFSTVPEVNKGRIATAPKIGIDPKINNTASGKDSIKKFTTEVKDKTINNVSEKTPKNLNFDWSSMGMGLPIISNAIKTIYNAATPVDYANVIAEQAYRDIPTMNLPRIGGKQVYRGIDKNRLTTPIINQGRATARDIQNTALTAGQALANLANANYNTQRAIGEAYANADQQDLANRLQVAQFNLGIDQANANLSQAEQAANIQRANRIAAARVQDAAMKEQLQQMKGQAIDETSTATVQGIADLTRQNIEWDMIKNNPELAEAIAIMSKGYSSKYGGMLTKRKRRN